MEKIKKFDDHKNFLNENWFQKNWNKAVASIKKKRSGWSEFIKELDNEGKLPNGVSVILANGEEYGMPYQNADMISSDAQPDWEDPRRMQLEESNTNGMTKVTLNSPNQNMLDADLKTVRNSIRERFNARIADGTLDALFIWGAPGIGKTEALVQAQGMLDVDLIIFHLSQIEPTDFKGVPYVIDQEFTEFFGKNNKQKRTAVRKRSAFALPLIFPTEGEKGRSPNGGILFFDELNQADEMVLSAALPLMLDGGYNGYELPKNWIVVAAGNRAIDTRVTKLGTPLAGRFSHINMIPTVDDWAKYAFSNKKIDKRLVAFFKANPEEFFELIIQRGDDNGPYASPRNWTKASYMVYHATKGKFNFYGDEGDSKQVWDEWTMRVGHKGADAYKVFLKVMSKISQKDIDEVYSKGLTPKIFNNLDPSDDFGLLQSLLIFVAGARAGTDNTAMTLKEFKNFMKFAGSFEHQGIRTLVLAALSESAGGSKGAWFKKDPDYMKVWFELAKSWSDEHEKRKKEAGL